MNRHFFRSFYLLLVVLITVVCSRSIAQQAQLSITFINLPDTIYEGVQYDTLHVTISNTSNGGFFDTLAIYIKQDTTNVSAELLYFGTALIAPGAVVVLQLDSHIFSPANFKAGGNTVVIWPVGQNAITVDSLHTDFFYKTLNGIGHNYNKESDLLVYPNPVTDCMFVVGEILPGDVRIYTLEGRMVYDKPFKEKRIDIGDLTPGMYLVEFRYRNNQRAYKKILKL